MLALQYIPNVTTLGYDPTKCNGCRKCIDVCPHEVFALVNKRAVIKNLDACMECGACVGNCEPLALSVVSGVGCAYGVIMGLLKGTEPTCGCDEGSGSCC
ncbi:MAG: 4Fe-4S binding protein [Calditrichaeota bacterium]|nr:4Fe-4S binding protein [Calditrichota bacterium]